MKTKWVNHGIASIITHNKIKTLEVNRNLKFYPELLKEILEHEKEHLKSNRLIDFKSDFLSFFKLKHKQDFIQFCLNNPMALQDIFPIQFRKKRNGLDIIVDWYSLLILIMLGCLIGVLWILM